MTQIKFAKNDSIAFFITINKVSGVFDNIFFTVKENSDGEALIQKTLGAGITLVDDRLYKEQLSYKVQITGVDTNNMEVGAHYLFDIKGIRGNAQKTLVAGELILSQTETGYISPAEQSDVTTIAETYNATFETGAQSDFVEFEEDPVALAKIGDMATLKTTSKDTIVKAVNEVKTANDTEVTARQEAISGEATARQEAISGEATARATADTAIRNDLTNGSLVAKKATQDDDGNAIKTTYCKNADITASGKPLYGYDTSKGTIEDRLTNMGFKLGSVAFSSYVTPLTNNRVRRQGNYCLMNVDFNGGGNTGILEVGTLPEDFRPSKTVVAYARIHSELLGEETYPSGTVLIKPSGEITVLNTLNNAPTNNVYMSGIGWSVKE